MFPIDNHQKTCRIHTMKLTLTAAEAAPLVATAIISLPAGTEIEIVAVPNPAPEVSSPSPTVIEQLRVVAMWAIEQVRIQFGTFGFEIDPRHKIPAIKLLRQFTPYGLAQAKWVVEHFASFANFVETKGRFPVLESDYSSHCPGSFNYKMQ